MMSPDGKWVWDGQKWIPVAVHESVFPAYTEAAAAAAAAPAPASPFAETMVAPPVNPFASPAAPPPFVGPPAGFSPAPAPAVVSPPIVQPGSYSAGGATPPWQAWASGGGDRTRTLYMVGAFIAVALGVVLTIYFGLSQLPFLRAQNDQPSASPSPVASPTPQLAVRSDSAVADRYVKSVFVPAIDIGGPLFQEHESCNGTLSVSCQQALTAADKAVSDAIARLKQTPPPACVAPQVNKVLADLNTTESGIKAGLKGFNDNNRVELQHGLATYNVGYKPFQPDSQAVLKAQALCDGQATGP